MDLHAPRLLHDVSQNIRSRDDQGIPSKSTPFTQHYTSPGHIAYKKWNAWKKSWFCSINNHDIHKDLYFSVGKIGFVQHVTKELSGNLSTFHIWPRWINFWSSYQTAYLQGGFFHSIWLLVDLPSLFSVIWLRHIWLNPFNWRILKIEFKE